MALSKYIQVNQQILLSYEYDNFAIDTSEVLDNEDYFLTNHNPYVITYLDGTLGFIDTYGNRIEKDTVWHNTPTYQRFPDQDRSNFYWPGYLIQDSSNEIYSLGISQNLQILENLRSLGWIRNYQTFESIFDSSSDVPQVLYYDTIKIYLVSGYIVNNYDGFSIRVTAGQTKTNVGASRVTLLDFVFFKDRLKDLIEWIPNPIYMNSRFYDRYIQVKVPSIYALVRLGSNQLNISRNLDLYIEFSTIQSDFVTQENPMIIGSGSSSVTLSGTCSFNEDTPVEAEVRMNSNSDYFNAAIYQDPDTYEIIYYPTYGSIQETRDLDIQVMSAIESGQIFLYTQGFNDVNTEIEKYDEIYSTESYQWCILNELNIRYVYQRLNEFTQEIETYVRSENQTNLIEYTGKTQQDGEFYKTYYNPKIREVNGYQIHSIIFNLICHLVNRMNGAEVTRSVAMTVTNPEVYMNLDKLDLRNLVTWKIFNKVENPSVIYAENSISSSTSAINKVFYSSDDIVVQQDGSYYTQGQGTLYLFKVDHNYRFNLYQASQTNTRIPYALSGPYKYVLILPVVDGTSIEIAPTYSANMNLGSGQVEYKITADQSKRAMAVAESDRYFAIMCKNSNGEKTNIYQGKLSYY